MCMFRDLDKDDIEVRVQSASEKGAVLLLYKNARVDMAVLDETVGQGLWQREHYECKGNLFCRVGIKIKDEWIWKSDCGAESNTEAEKGEASDSFKRACFNWGIGRELYTAPFIWVSAEKLNLTQKQTQKGTTYACYDSFSVEDITVKDKKIVSLKIYNDKKKITAFMYGSAKSEDGGFDPSELPFPEAYREKPAPVTPPNPMSLQTKIKTRDDAAAYKIDGMTLTDLYKKDKKRFMELLNNPTDADMAAATKLIYEWVLEASRSAKG